MVLDLSLGLQIIELGLIMSFVGLGTFISSYLLHFNDLSIEGSFACGAAISVLMAKMGVAPYGQLLASLLAGCLVGLLTSTLHFKLGVNKIIAGLLSATAMFSINLKLVGPHALMPMGLSIFGATAWLGQHHKIITIAIISALVLLVVTKLLRSQIGLLLKASGDNQVFVRSLGKNAIYYQTLGLMLANALGALSGYLFTSFTGFFSITSSVGVLPIALAGIILSGMSATSVPYKIVVGSMLYQLTIIICIGMNMDPSWNRLITAVIVLALIIVQKTHAKTGGVSI